MTDREVFERRFRTALHRHVADGPTEFDALAFAHAVAAKAPRRGGLTTALGWPVVAIPRLAWTLLLLAALMVAMVGGMLMAGSQANRKLAAVLPPIGQLYTCPTGSTPDEPGSPDQARPAGIRTMAFDRRAGRLVAMADPGTWTFDVCTNTWTRMHPDREPPGFGWRSLVYDVDSDLTIGVAYGPDGNAPGRVWAYDFQANTWTEKAGPTDKTLRAYDPLTGLVLATKDDLGGTAPAERWMYDVETNTWTPGDQANGPVWHAAIAYDASVDRFIAYAAPETWLFDIRTGTWWRSGVAAPVVEPNWAVPTIAYDEAAKRTVVAGSSGWAAYDAAADRWEVLAERGGSFATPIAYDAVNQRLIGVSQGGIAVQGDLVAIDLVTREWTVLLEASLAPPTP
jgi:hypothetical protein